MENFSDITMQQKMEKELNNRFNQPWPKLDRGSKLNRLCLHIKKIKIDKDLDDNDEKKLKTLLIRVLDSGGLNKISEIEYSIEKAEIIILKNLIYNNESNSFTYNTKKKKKSETSKSKSNIDRHFTRSKDNHKLHQKSSPKESSSD
jgi:hypothetical protein|tara:strand:+ start:27 stop:464 length:438 start_codon:yes stop_codon:yes gene_type:complete